jgi:hypothetical protein
MGLLSAISLAMGSIVNAFSLDGSALKAVRNMLPAKSQSLARIR